MLRLKYESSCNCRLSLFSPWCEDILKKLEETIEAIHVRLRENMCFENFPCFERLKLLTTQGEEMPLCDRSKMSTEVCSDEVVAF